MSIVTRIVTPSLSDLSPTPTGGATYTPAMMRFDGAGYYTDGATFTTSGNQTTAVCRFRVPSSPASDERVIESKDSSGRFRLLISAHSDGTMRALCQNSSGTTICQLYSSTGFQDNSVHTLLFSFDSGAGTAVYLIDGSNADDTGNGSRIAPTTGTLAGGAGTRLGVGAGDTGSGPFTGDIGFIGLDDQYITSVSGFFDGSGNPVKQDESVWANSAWGSQPLFWNEHGEMSNNKGSAGNMTEIGTIVVADAVDPAA